MAINNRIIDMDPVIKQILNSSLIIDLPVVFVTTTTNPAQKKEGNDTPAGQQQGVERGGRSAKAKATRMQHVSTSKTKTWLKNSR